MARRPQAGPARAPDGFLPFQHPRLVEAPPTGAGWLHEIKFDGYRMQVHVAGGRARFYTRNGHDWSDRFKAQAALAARLGDCVLDAEMIACNAEGYSDFSSLRSKLHRDPDALVFMVFDILFKGVEDLRPYALAARKSVLAKTLKAGGPEVESGFRYVPPAPGEGRALLSAACKLKWEGIVSKSLAAPYRGGEERNGTWVKAKCRPSAAIIVGGYVTSNDRFSYLIGGVREPDGRLRYVGSIKGGYGAAAMKDLWPRVKALETDVSPFEIARPKKTSDIHWLKPDLIAEVEMAEFTGSGKLRQASFKGLRDDIAEQ